MKKIIDSISDSDSITVHADFAFDPPLVIINSREFSNSNFAEIILEKSKVINLIEALQDEINKIED